MKALPIVLAAVAVVVLVRIGLRHRGSSRSSRVAEPETGGAAPDCSGTPVWWPGARSESEFVVVYCELSQVILFVVVAAAVVIPTIHTGTPTRQNVGVVAGSTDLDTELQKLASTLKLPLHLVNEPDLKTARASLSNGHLDMVVDAGEKILVLKPIAETDTSTEAQYVRAVAATLGAQQTFARAGLSPEQAVAVSEIKPVPVQSLQLGKKARTSQEATALIGVILIFVVLTQYLTWTLMGVLEEKASRVVEVLLATVRPSQLLAGKLVGIGVVALLQALALVAFALILAEVVGSSLVHGAAPLVVAATLLWLVLGYAFYSWMYAAAGSMAERQDQVQSLALPLSAPLIFGYIVSLIGVSSGSASLLVKVLAYLPPTAPFAMPTLVGFGEVTWWQFLASVVVDVVCTVVVARMAARVYRTAVLRTGARSGSATWSRPASRVVDQPLSTEPTS